MAEVSLRLLRSKARQYFIEEKLPCGRKHGASLAPPCELLGDCREAVGSETSYRLRLYTVWPSGVPRNRTLDTRMSSRQELRLYSHWAGSRSSYHQNGNGRNGAAQASPPYRSRTAYYDILEVTKNATQSQIKTAYYKQSFRFHPDRNHGNEDGARQFGLVTEAYHILGNASLRRKYDHGILSLEDIRSAKKPSVKSDSPVRKEAGGQREATMSSGTPARPVFDFDAFYQAHYGEQLAREKMWKARREQIEKEKRKKNMDNRFNWMTEVSALLVVSATLVILTLR